ncbi:hypothetical protein Q0590_13790 [Rhodocytophaga aerolata]|uniref:Uncharacterized protein n=1 Tax=Rhodocytophaga aerolata TaxID=455078 RepID=A0ABT8R5G3_9BACT|nr:hypothetical protein [Rhodocytophaga aerolata]MDO1447335.1 hypothetical protein [Rhodocytophaga aerolata]
MKYFLIILFSCFLLTAGMAQSNVRKKDSKNTPSSRSASSVDIGSENSIFMDTKKSAVKRKSDVKTMDDLKQEAKERMMANAKKHEKMAKEMEKPQYSDPSYFGHKNPPKKRKPGKKKFCKECRIRH